MKKLISVVLLLISVNVFADEQSFKQAQQQAKCQQVMNMLVLYVKTEQYRLQLELNNVIASPQDYKSEAEWKKVESTNKHRLSYQQKREEARYGTSRKPNPDMKRQTSTGYAKERNLDE